MSAFYEKLVHVAAPPRDRRPCPGKFEAALRRQAEAGADSGVRINLSSGPSATMEPARTATRRRRDLLAHVVDSPFDHLGPRHAAARCRGGRGRSGGDDVLAVVDDPMRRTHVIGALDTRRTQEGRPHRRRGGAGRLAPLDQATVDISTGEVEEAGRARTRRQGPRHPRDRVVEHGRSDHLHVTERDSRDADAMVELVVEAGYERSERQVGHIGPVIGAHGGPRMTGVTWLDPS